MQNLRILLFINVEIRIICANIVFACIYYIEEMYYFNFIKLLYKN